MITVMPDWLISLKRPITSIDVVESRAPVGSSASIILGLVISALEIAIFTFVIYIIEQLSINRSYDVLLYIRFSIIFLIILVISGFNFWFRMRL